VTGPFGPTHVLGLVLLVAVAALGVVMMRRRAVVTFGIAWVAVTLLPVSNLIAITGVILAERTLFLPSAGAMLAIGGIAAHYLPRFEAARPAGRTGIMVALALVIAGGAVRSAERQLAWKDQAGFIRRLERDAPTTYRAHLVAMNYYAESGRYPESVRAAERAYALFKGDPQVFEQYGQSLRRTGRCPEALPILSEGIGRFPGRTLIRSRFIECALSVGDTASAIAVATEGVARGSSEFEQTLKRLR
jgi:hypothetical protein